MSAKKDKRTVIYPVNFALDYLQYKWTEMETIKKDEGTNCVNGNHIHAGKKNKQNKNTTCCQKLFFTG